MTRLEDVIKHFGGITRRLSNENNAHKLLLDALVESHPDPTALAAALEKQIDNFMAAALPQDLSDADIEAVREPAARAAARSRSLALALQAATPNHRRSPEK